MAFTHEFFLRIGLFLCFVAIVETSVNACLINTGSKLVLIGTGAAGALHISFPGLGRLRAAAGGKSFTWVHLNYSSLK